MMTQDAVNSTPTLGAGTPSAPASATNVLENLAARVRPAGLCLLMVRPDGTVTYHDSAAGTFFLRYVVPLIQYPQPTESGLSEKLGEVTINSAAVVWNSLPGIVVAGLPFV